MKGRSTYGLAISTSESQDVIAALRVAADQYAEDAACCRRDGFERLALGFEQQRVRAIELAERLDGVEFHTLTEGE